MLLLQYGQDNPGPRLFFNPYFDLDIGIGPKGLAIGLGSAADGFGTASRNHPTHSFYGLPQGIVRQMGVALRCLRLGMYEQPSGGC